MDYLLIHRTQGKNAASQAHPYMTIESYLRPYTKFYMTTEAEGRRIYQAIMDRKNEAIPNYLAVIIIIFETLLTLIQTLFEGKRIKLKLYRKAKLTFRYSLAKLSFFEKFENRDDAIKINKEIIEHGGVTKYLCFDNVDYVTGLASTFKWNKSGKEVFEELLKYRFEQGRCLPAFQ